MRIEIQLNYSHVTHIKREPGDNVLVILRLQRLEWLRVKLYDSCTPTIAQSHPRNAVSGICDPFTF